MIDIIGLYPLQGNGGIASWTKKFLVTFPDAEFNIHPVNIAPAKDFSLYKGLDRLYYGFKAYLDSVRGLNKTLKAYPSVRIMHTTTSGGGGVFRDNTVVKICHKHGLKCVMHCRFGSIKELYESNSVVGRKFRENIQLFDQVWVLDRHSLNFLQSHESLASKIHLTPNSIMVPSQCDLEPKKYQRVSFIGNVLPTKGIVELVAAIKELDGAMTLTIAGPASPIMLEQLKIIAGEAWSDYISYKGKLPNEEAVELVNNSDIIALPTYYPGEAFPISIIEAMSLGKLVVSCPRAAIPDMLTDLDGNRCGILVSPKSTMSLKQGLQWVLEHKEECDKMCAKAYEKVKNCYDTSVIYDLYRELFKQLTNGTI